LIPAPPAGSTGPLMRVPPALPAPRTEETLEVVVPSFQLFARQVCDDHLREAARTLAILLDISEGRGMQCVRMFHRRWQDDEAFIVKPMQLRNEVMSSSYNNALMLLAECFGLVGIEAIGVLQSLRARYLESA
jgi:hypothetical protein